MKKKTEFRIVLLTLLLLAITPLVFAVYNHPEINAETFDNTNGGEILENDSQDNLYKENENITYSYIIQRHPEIKTGFNKYLTRTEPVGDGLVLVINKQTESIPVYLRQHIKEIYNGSKEIMGPYAGLAYQTEGVVILSDEGVENDFILYHEIGHLIDYRFSPNEVENSKFNWTYLSGEDAWLKVWEEEWKDLGYNASTPIESFADAFGLHMTGRIWEGEVAPGGFPRTKQYMNNLFQKIREHYYKDLNNTGMYMED